MTTRKQIWCTREDLNLHAARAAASEAAASAVSPRVHRCRWCWLEDSNLPPLAYETSALPDELNQRAINKKRRGAAPVVEATLRVRRGSAPRPGVDVDDVKERGATSEAGAVVKLRTHGAGAHANARPRHMGECR